MNEEGGGEGVTTVMFYEQTYSIVLQLVSFSTNRRGVDQTEEKMTEELNSKIQVFKYK